MCEINQRFSEYGPWASSVTATWKLVRNAQPQAAPSLLAQKLEMEPSDPGFAKPCGDAGAHRDLLPWRGLRSFLRVLKCHRGDGAGPAGTLGEGSFGERPQGSFGMGPPVPQGGAGWARTGLEPKRKARSERSGVRRLNQDRVSGAGPP